MSAHNPTHHAVDVGPTPMSRALLRSCLGLLIVVASVISLSAASRPTAEPRGPEMPRAYVDTTYAPSSGRIIALRAGANFQAALDAARPGDVITLEAGATFVGSFTLPNKLGADWIIIRTSAPDGNLPPPG